MQELDKPKVISNLLIPTLIAALVGLFVLYAPDAIGIEGLEFFLIFTFFGSFVCGMILARIWTGFWWLWPFIFALAYPVKVALEIVYNPTSHNLWPTEMAFCVPYIVTGLFGAFIGKHSKNSK